VVYSSTPRWQPKKFAGEPRSIWGQVMVRRDTSVFFCTSSAGRVMAASHILLRFCGVPIFSRQGTPMGPPCAKYAYVWFNCPGLIENNNKKPAPVWDKARDQGGVTRPGGGWQHTCTHMTVVVVSEHNLAGDPRSNRGQVIINFRKAFAPTRGYSGVL
jgi:hypothetical protein